MNGIKRYAPTRFDFDNDTFVQQRDERYCKSEDVEVLEAELAKKHESIAILVMDAKRLEEENAQLKAENERLKKEIIEIDLYLEQMQQSRGD